MRLVLDTNVCLDLFVFADPRVATLQAALASGEVEAVTRADCRDEWLAVLGYPMLALDEGRRASAAARFDRCVRLLPDARPEVALPQCRDADDQKFLEVAATSGASALLSRDAELLRLARRTLRDGLFAIATPEHWQTVPTIDARRLPG